MQTTPPPPAYLSSSLSRWREAFNPMRGLTIEKCVNYLEEYQRGIMGNIQWLFNHIESQDATLMTVVENLDAAVGEIDWTIAQISPDSQRFDKVLAAEQEAFLRAVYERIENLGEAISHLTLARFRGFSHLAPWCRVPGDLTTLYRLNPIDQWNMVRRGYAGPWAYNPSGDPISYEQTRPEYRLSDDDIITRTRARYVNRIGLIKYIRATTAEKDWDAYVEIYGVPACFIILPENIPTDKADKTLISAQDAAMGGSGVLPGGSDIKTLAENRNTQPFQTRLEWLEKQLVLAATGGQLTVLAESGSGTLAGSVHKTVWDTLAQAEADKVSETFQRWIDRRLLNDAFPGKPHLAFFSLNRPEEKDVGEIVTQICQLRQAGIEVKPEQIEEMTGYTISAVRDPSATPQSAPIGAPSAAFSQRPPETPPKTRRDRLTPLWLRLRREGFAPVAERVYAILAAPPEEATEKARQLLADLPTLGDELMANNPLGEAIAEELRTRYHAEEDKAAQELQGSAKSSFSKQAPEEEPEEEEEDIEITQEEAQRIYDELVASGMIVAGGSSKRQGSFKQCETCGGFLTTNDVCNKQNCGKSQDPEKEKSSDSKEDQEENSQEDREAKQAGISNRKKPQTPEEVKQEIVSLREQVSFPNMKPEEIEARERLLQEFEVSDDDGNKVKFGRRILKHYLRRGKSAEDIRGRLRYLPFAEDAVKSTKPLPNPHGPPQLKLYTKPIDATSAVMVFVDTKTEAFFEVVTVYPNS